MTLVYLYNDHASRFDRLFEDTLAAQLCPRACVYSTQAGKAASQHDEVYPSRPRVDIHESKDSNTVTATFELPGLTGQDVAIDIHQNRLTVSSGESMISDSEEGRSYIIRECHSGKFSRTLQLPIGTQPENVKAKMENGILTITFPQTIPEHPAKRIVVH